MSARALLLATLLLAATLAGCASEAPRPAAPSAAPTAEAPREPLVPKPGQVSLPVQAPALPLAAQASTDPAQDAQVAVYHLDAQAPTDGHYETPDASGHGRHALVGAAPTLTGLYGGAYRFRMAQDYLSLPDAMTSGLAAGAVTMWVNATPGKAGVLLMKRDLGGADELSILLDETGRVLFATSEAAGSSVLSSATPLVAGTFSHLAVTWGPEGKRIYLNGHLDAQDADPTGVGSSSRFTCLGMDPELALNRGFDGAIDEVRVYGRALTPGEVAVIMWLH